MNARCENPQGCRVGRLQGRCDVERILETLGTTTTIYYDLFVQTVHAIFRYVCTQGLPQRWAYRRRQLKDNPSSSAPPTPANTHGEMKLMRSNISKQRLLYVSLYATPRSDEKESPGFGEPRWLDRPDILGECARGVSCHWPVGFPAKRDWSVDRRACLHT